MRGSGVFLTDITIKRKSKLNKVETYVKQGLVMRKMDQLDDYHKSIALKDLPPVKKKEWLESDLKIEINYIREIFAL